MKKRKHRTRRLRRTAKQVRKHGPKAKRRHAERAGRSGSIQSKKTPPKNKPLVAGVDTALLLGRFVPSRRLDDLEASIRSGAFSPEDWPRLSRETTDPEDAVAKFRQIIREASSKFRPSHVVMPFGSVIDGVFYPAEGYTDEEAEAARQEFCRAFEASQTAKSVFQFPAKPTAASEEE